MQKEERESGEGLLREYIRELCGERRTLSFRLASPPSSSHGL